MFLNIYESMCTSLFIIVAYTLGNSSNYLPMMRFIYGPGHAKTCLKPYANNKGADQPAHPRSLISTFVVHVAYIV